MSKLQVKLNSGKSNYQMITELKKTIKEDNIANSIIFYDTLIGSYNTRKVKPKNFTSKRQMSGLVYEIDGIIEQREKTLNELSTKNSKEVLEELIKEVSNITNDVPIGGVYEEIKSVRKTEEIYKIGETIAKRINNRKKEIIKDKSQKRRAHVFIEESNCIKDAIRSALEKEY
jgi:hypothetical protein